MATETIRDYLVSLGFKVDESGYKKFIGGMESATKSVFKLVGAIEAAALTIGAGVAAFASNLEALYFAANRTGASATNLKAFEKAAQNLGASSGEALQSVEALARYMRNNPGSEGILQSLGVQTRDVNGKMRDTVDIMADLGKELAKRPQYLANQYGNMFGISEKTLLAMRNGDFQRELDKQRALLKDAGFQKAAQDAHDFEVKLRNLQTRIEAIGVQIGNSLIDALGPQMEQAAKWFDKNGYQIGQVVAGIASAILKAAGIIMPILGTIADGWKNIFGWVKILGQEISKLLSQNMLDKIGAGTAWLLDKLGIRSQVDNLMSHDDTSAPAAAAAPGSATGSKALFSGLEDKYKLPHGLLDSVWNTESGRGAHMTSPVGAQGHFQFMPGTARQYGLKNPNNLVESATAAAKMYSDLLQKYHGNVPKALAGYNWGTGNVDRYGLGSAPYETRNYIDKVTRGMSGSSVQIAQTTNINVNGSDASSTGRAVAGEQGRVNEAMARNMQAAAM